MTRLISAASTLLVLAAWAAPVSAFEAQLALGSGGGSSTWSGDPNVYGTMKIAYRPLDMVSVDFTGKLGYGAVDERILEWFSVGSELWLRWGSTRPAPGASVSPTSTKSRGRRTRPIRGVPPSVSETAFGTVREVSVGAGIDIPFVTFSLGTMSITLDTSASWFPDPRGPQWYFDATVGVAFDYSS